MIIAEVLLALLCFLLGLHWGRRSVRAELIPRRIINPVFRRVK